MAIGLRRNSITAHLSAGWMFINGALGYFLPASIPAQVGHGLICLSDKITPLNYANSATGSTRLVQHTCMFGVPRPEDSSSQDSIDWFTCEIQVGGQGVTVPNQNYRWASNNQPLSSKDVEVQAIIPEIELTLKCERMLKLGVYKMASLIGTTNNSPFTVPNDDTLPTGSMLFLGDNGSQKFTSEGYQYATRSLKFAVRLDGWNKIFNPDTGQLEAITPSPFSSADHSPLFVG